MPTPAALPDILIRTKSPRPRIQPSWVKEKVMSSMSVDDDDRSSSEGEFAQSGVVRRNHKATMAARREENLARFALHATHISDSGTSLTTPPPIPPRVSPIPLTETRRSSPAPSVDMSRKISISSAASTKRAGTSTDSVNAIESSKPPVSTALLENMEILFSEKVG
ncbi:hypothetical protein TELCIR_20536 [Teladorsagia circumcincta]|uniref:Uncharacterized protein n=1 Tax=Teladorsagia circumcincta TaxID=45464 RepID=A0A2G9TJ82_TELCI|nr:hypothetical protein TELCIR_20536 [Teladorsagia circumcincta]